MGRGDKDAPLGQPVRADGLFQWSCRYERPVNCKWDDIKRL